MTDSKMWTDWAGLAAPFDDDHLDWRVMECGIKNDKPWAKLAAYVDSRAIMNRLDAVVGVGGWQTEFRNISIPEGVGIICKLSVYDREFGRWVSKEDGAGFNRGIETVKSGVSDSFKRAANMFGMGRHLYTIGETWADNIQTGYPPRGSSAVRIYSKAKGLNHWCPAPRLGRGQPGGVIPVDGDPTKVPPPNSGQYPEYVKKDDRIKAIYKLEQVAYGTDIELNDGRMGALGDKVPEDAVVKKLEAYQEQLEVMSEKRDRVIRRIGEVEKDTYPVQIARTAARKKYLDTDDPTKASLNKLMEYGAHMKQRGQ